MQEARLSLFSLVLSSAAFSMTAPVSRRAANASYSLWTISHSTLLLSLCAAAEAWTPQGHTPALFQALARRHGMLGAFLGANLLTVRQIRRAAHLSLSC